MHYYGEEIEQRVLEHAKIFIQERCTVRKVAEYTGFCKTTVHLDLTTRLVQIDSVLAEKVREIIDVNIEERADRGGAATKAKFESQGK